MGLKLETISTWVNTLTPIFESKTFSLMLALGFAFFMYWSSTKSIMQQQEINKGLWIYIQDVHAKHIHTVIDLVECRGTRPHAFEP